MHTHGLDAVTTWLGDIRSQRVERVECVVKPHKGDFVTKDALFEHMRALARAPVKRALRELCLRIQHRVFASAQQLIGQISLGVLRPLEGCCGKAA